MLLTFKIQKCIIHYFHILTSSNKYGMHTEKLQIYDTLRTKVRWP